MIAILRATESVGLLQQIIGRGLRVDAFDISPTGVEKARALAAQRGVAVDFAVADCSSLAWPEAEYNGVAAIFIQPEAALDLDALRLALLRALGYEATATEFIPSAHTPKNRLILAERRGRYNKAGLASFLALKAASGDAELALEREVKDLLAERFPA